MLNLRKYYINNLKNLVLMIRDELVIFHNFHDDVDNITRLSHTKIFLYNFNIMHICTFINSNCLISFLYLYNLYKLYII